MTQKRKKKNPVQSKNRARPMAARLKKKKPRAEQEPRSAHGRAVNNCLLFLVSVSAYLGYSAFGCLVSSIRTSRLASGFSVKSTRSWIRTVISRRLRFVHIPMSSASRELISPMSLHKVLIYVTELKNYWNNWSITITIATKEIYSKIMKTFMTFGC